MQIPGSVGVDNDGDGVNDGFVGAVTNAAASTISGLEIEGNVLLGEALSLQYSAGFLDASFDEYLVGGVDVSSDRDVQNTPEEMVFVGVNYHLPAFSGDLLLSANYAYKGDIQQFEIASEDIDQDAYGIWNASVVWTSDSAAWLVGLHGKNLADEA